MNKIQEKRFCFDSLAHATQDGCWFSTQIDASLSRLLRNMDYFNVNKSVLAGLPIKEFNDYVVQVYKKYPDRFYPVPALTLENSVLEQIQNYKAQNIKAVKIHPRMLQIPLDGEWISNAMATCESEKMHLFLCTITTGLNNIHNTPMSKTISSLCRKYEKLKIVLLHGGYLELLATAEEVRSLSNIIIDISLTLPRFYDASIGRDIVYLARTLDGKICLGTDFPEKTYDDIFKSLKCLGVDVEDALWGSNLYNFLFA